MAKSYAGQVRGRRRAPSPNSILDRKALKQALDDEGIAVKKIHMDAFYQAMHRQHYPSLRRFVDNYYAYERGEDVENDMNGPNAGSTAGLSAGPTAGSTAGGMIARPLKNKITSRKNKNRSQLPKVLLEYLTTTQDFVTTTSTIRERITSKDRSTTKLIVQLHDGQVVESVIMRYAKKGSGRASLCVSSQCGCAMGCTFCATGTMGLSGNLTTGEILEQLVHADYVLAEEHMRREDKSKKIDLVRNVVFMGMGEPLDNYGNVVEACRGMMDRKRWNLAHGRVTVSTVGLVSQIRKLTADLPEVGLALSLHAPNQEARTAIVPTAARYPIEDLIDALDGHMMAYLRRRVGGNYTKEERAKESARRRAMIEYVMLEGESSTFKCAHQLGKLCENRQLVVNLIPYNATDVKDKLRCPSDEHMQEFKKIVSSYGAFCTIRRTMGADIAGACGQLVKKTQGGEGAPAVVSTKNDERTPLQHDLATHLDIEDVMLPHASSASATSVTTTGAVTPAAHPNETADHSASEEVEKDDVRTGRSMLSSSSVPSRQPWLSSLSNQELYSIENILTVATAVAASSFLASSVILLRKKR